MALTSTPTGTGQSNTRWCGSASEGTTTRRGTWEGDVIEQLESVERQHDLAPAHASNTGPRRLRNVLDRLHHATGRQVVVLVDEYDKPILDVLDNPDLAKANRDWLRGFYGIVKDSADHVRFVFVTGVSTFSKVSLFSGLNNLRDITLDPRYATVCGYTDNDLDTVFAPELEGLNREEIRRWYNGYHWLGEEKVYNPFDLLLLFDSRKFKPWWFRTGSPSFLFQQLMDKEVSPMELERRVTDEQLVSKFDVGGHQRGRTPLPDRLPHPYRGGMGRRPDLLHPGLPQPGGAPEPETRGSSPIWAGRARRPPTRARNWPDCWPTTTSTASQRTSGPSSPVSPTSGTAKATWHATRPGTPGCSTPASAPSAWTCGWKTPPAADAPIWSSCTTHRCSYWKLKVARGEGGADTAHLLHKAIQQMQQRGYGEKYRHREEPIHLVALVFGWQNRNLDAVKAVRA